jgi:prepilin-type processing-associated H-X9-DG protein
LTTTPVLFSYGISHALNASGLWSVAVYPAPYKYARKTSELVVPGPSQTWVFTEPWSGFTAPTFGFYITQNRLWGHLPTDRHSLGANFSFADGHTQRRHWKAPKETRASDVIQPGGDRADYTWLVAGLPELP